MLWVLSRMENLSHHLTLDGEYFESENDKAFSRDTYVAVNLVVNLMAARSVKAISNFNV